MPLPEGRMRKAMSSALLCLGSGRRWEGGYDHCTSLPGKLWSVPEFFDRDGKDVTMTHDLHLLGRGWGSGDGLCPSDPEKWRRVVMAIPDPSSKRKLGR